MSFSVIAAIGKNRELGKNGKLLWRIPADLEFFKKTTIGHSILMGRKTFESLPKILPGRKHYVLSRKPKTDTDSVSYITDLSSFTKEHENDEEEIFVIGGGMVYWEMIKHAKKIYLTEIQSEDEAADTFFPEFDQSLYEKQILGQGEQNGIKYSFILYNKK